MADFFWYYKKPNWADAPEWAMWLAQDSDRSWWWFNKRPEKGERYWKPSGHLMKRADVPVDAQEWATTLEERPTP